MCLCFLNNAIKKKPLQLKKQNQTNPRLHISQRQQQTDLSPLFLCLSFKNEPKEVAKYRHFPGQIPQFRFIEKLT